MDRLSTTRVLCVIHSLLIRNQFENSTTFFLMLNVTKHQNDQKILQQQPSAVNVFIGSD